MSKFYLCAAGVTLRDQMNRRWPKRDKASDGWIGDASHQARPSDHNPDWSAGGVVRAIDIDKDIDNVNDKELAWKIADKLREQAASDGRISYIIFDGRIASARRNLKGKAWQWRKYSGANPHRFHIHVSFTKKGDDDGRKFDLNVDTKSAPVANVASKKPANAKKVTAKKTTKKVADRPRRANGGGSAKPAQVK